PNLGGGSSSGKRRKPRGAPRLPPCTTAPCSSVERIHDFSMSPVPLLRAAKNQTAAFPWVPQQATRMDDYMDALNVASVGISGEALLDEAQGCSRIYCSFIGVSVQDA
ncbi:unnamed protein product, partial [Urochloa humidicola]